MPTIKLSTCTLLKQWIRDNAERSTKSKAVFSQQCQKQILCVREEFELMQHSNASAHVAARKLLVPQRQTITTQKLQFSYKGSGFLCV